MKKRTREQENKRTRDKEKEILTKKKKSCVQWESNPRPPLSPLHEKK